MIFISRPLLLTTRSPPTRGSFPPIYSVAAFDRHAETLHSAREFFAWCLVPRFIGIPKRCYNSQRRPHNRFKQQTKKTRLLAPRSTVGLMLIYTNRLDGFTAPTCHNVTGDRNKDKLPFSRLHDDNILLLLIIVIELLYLQWKHSGAMQTVHAVYFVRRDSWRRAKKNVTTREIILTTPPLPAGWFNGWITIGLFDFNNYHLVDMTMPPPAPPTDRRFIGSKE